MVELIDLVTLLFFYLKRPYSDSSLSYLDPVTLTVLLFEIYLFLPTPVFVLQWLSLNWEILVTLLSVSINFPINSEQDALLYCVAYDYPGAD